MKILITLALAAPLFQGSTEPLSKGGMNRLLRSLETGNEAKAEEAVQKLLAAGLEVLPHLPDSLVRAEKLRSEGEVTHETVERIRALRMRIASAHEEAFEALLEQADDPRAAVQIRTQHALAVLPGDTSRKLITRWRGLTQRQQEASVYALIAAGDASARDRLSAVIQGTEGESVNARLRAAMGLRAFEPTKDSIEALEWAVLDENADVAAGACTTLWSYGAEGVDGLVFALESRKREIPDLASALLADLGDVSKAAVLKALLEDPRNQLLLRVASIVAPGDPITVEAFLKLRKTKLARLREELLMALPRLSLQGGTRVEILTNALADSKLSVVEEAAIAALQLPDAEFKALTDSLRNAWLRKETSDRLLQSTSAAVARLALPVEDHLDWCARRMILRDTKGKIAAAVLAGTVPPDQDEALAQRVRTSASDDVIYWLASLTGRTGAAESILVEAAVNGPSERRPSILGYLAMSSFDGDEAVELLREALADPRSPSGKAALRGYAQTGSAPEGLLSPLLRTHQELSEGDQVLVLDAAARSEPVPKRLGSTARRALLESPSERVRARAAAALGRAGGSKTSHIKVLLGALKRDGEPKGAEEKETTSTGPRISATSRASGVGVMGAIAGALADLEATDKATIRALAASLEGPRDQVILVSEALRRLSPASARAGEALANMAWQSDLLARGACLRALSEIEGAGVHADAVLASVALVQYAELSGMALDALEALPPEDRALVAPYLRCVTFRNSSPLLNPGWTRPPMEEPWAVDFGIAGPLTARLDDLEMFQVIRERAEALLD